MPGGGTGRERLSVAEMGANKGGEHDETTTVTSGTQEECDFDAQT